jgi:hypothetical protein
MLPRANYLLGGSGRQGVAARKRKEHSEKRSFKKPGGGLIDPQGEAPHHEPGRSDDAVTEPTEELPPEGLGKKSPDQDLGKPARQRAR